MTLWAVLLTTLGLPNADTAKPTDAEVRQAVERSVVYLQEEAVDWIHTYKCASCHHGGLGIWSLNESAARGIDVDKAALKELTGWILWCSPAEFLREPLFHGRRLDSRDRDWKLVVPRLV
jgi:hypothetical protein